jgi:hypothetical protein
MAGRREGAILPGRRPEDDAAEVRAGAAVQGGNPQPLFETHVTSTLTNTQPRYAVTRDGQRFLIPTPMGEAGSMPAPVVVIWMAGTKR